MGKYVDRAGMQVGRLTVIANAGHLGSDVIWKCKCSCGKIVNVRSASLSQNRTRSCGCLARDIVIARSTKHGHANRGKISSEWWSYTAAKLRCNNPKDCEYDRYGGRGIEFRFSSFEEFLSELGLKPSPKHSVDRINTNGHYEKGNVRWANAFEQARNRRPRTRPTHCKKGHLFTEETTRITKQGTRSCKICRKEYKKIYNRCGSKL